MKAFKVSGWLLGGCLAAYISAGSFDSFAQSPMPPANNTAATIPDTQKPDVQKNASVKKKDSDAEDIYKGDFKAYIADQKQLTRLHGTDKVQNRNIILLGTVADFPYNITIKEYAKLIRQLDDVTARVFQNHPASFELAINVTLFPDRPASLLVSPKSTNGSGVSDTDLQMLSDALSKIISPRSRKQKLFSQVWYGINMGAPAPDPDADAAESKLPPPADAPAGCEDGVAQKSNTLYSYFAKGGSAPEYYSIAGIGNHQFLFDSDMTPVPPEELAERIKKSPKYERAKKIVLLWSYSAWGDAPYKTALQKLLGKPVEGFPGPIWVYPDGAILSGYAERSNLHGPDNNSIAQCFTKDGDYQDDMSCRPLLNSYHTEDGIFSNAAFVRGCREITQLQNLASTGDAKASLQLFYFYSFVVIDRAKAEGYLSDAAVNGDPLANYIAALFLRDKDIEMSRQFMQDSAAKGFKKAQEALKTYPPIPPTTPTPPPPAPPQVPTPKP